MTTIHAAVIDSNKKIEASVSPQGDIIVKNYTGTVGTIPLYFAGLRDVAASSFTANGIVQYNTANNTYYGSNNLTVGNLSVTGNTNITNISANNFSAPNANIVALSTNTLQLRTAIPFTLAGDVVSDTINFNGGAITFNIKLKNDVVNLGQHTSGNYVKSVIAAPGSPISMSGTGEGAEVVVDIATANTSGQRGVVSFANNFAVSNGVASITSISGTNTTITLKSGNTTSPLLNREVLVDPVRNALVFNNNGTRYTLRETTKSLIDSLNVDADTWDGRQFNDFINQPVRSTDNVAFNNVTVSGKFNGSLNGTVSSLSNHSTSNLSEGTNLYYTLARANNAIDGRVNKTYVDALNINASTLGGLSSSDFMRSGTAAVSNSSITANGVTSTGDLTVDRAFMMTLDGGVPTLRPYFNNSYSSDKEIRFENGGWLIEGHTKFANTVTLSEIKSSNNAWAIAANGQMSIGGYKVYHDGYKPTADRLTNPITITISGDSSGSFTTNGSANGSFNTTVRSFTVGNEYTEPRLQPTNKVASFYSSGIITGEVSGISVSSSNNENRVWQIYSETSGVGGVRNLHFRSGRGTVWDNSQKIWTDVNDGSGSGLDADLWDSHQFDDYINQPLRTTDNVVFNKVTASVEGTVSSIANHNTTNLSEGTNLYYTIARANSAIDTRVTKSFVDALNINASTVGGLSHTQFLRSDQDGTLNHKLTVSNVDVTDQLKIGASVTGGGHALAIGKSGDRVWLAPTNKAGGYDTTKELTYDASGDAKWNAKGGFKTSNLTVTGNTSINGSLSLSGNLTVTGNTTFLNTTNLDVSDATITLNKGQPTPLNDVGMLMQRYASPNTTNFNVSVIWKEDTDKFVFGSTTDTGNTNVSTFIDEFMVVTKDKKLGIGTGTPSKPLHVKSSTPAILLEGSTSNTSIESDGAFVINTTAPSFDLQYNSTSRLKIDSVGKVGIGRAPETKLDVDGDFQFNGIRMASKTTVVASTTTTSLFEFAKATFGFAKVRIAVKEGTNRQASELLITHDGTTAHATEYGVIYTNNILSDFDVDILGNNVRILSKAKTNTSKSFKVMVEMYKD